MRRRRRPEDSATAKAPMNLLDSKGTLVAQAGSSCLRTGPKTPSLPEGGFKIFGALRPLLA